MSHIATQTSIPESPPCHYYGRAFTVARFYKTPMVLRIKELRESRKWTQQELADRSNMSRSQLAMIEAETRPANTIRLNAISKALGVKPEALFDNADGDRALVDKIKDLQPDDRLTIIRMVEALGATAAKDG